MNKKIIGFFLGYLVGISLAFLSWSFDNDHTPLLIFALLCILFVYFFETKEVKKIVLVTLVFIGIGIGFLKADFAYRDFIALSKKVCNTSPPPGFMTRAPFKMASASNPFR